MLKHLNFLTFFAVLFFFVPSSVKSQNDISSPYSGYGIGVLTEMAPGSQAAMGGTAYAIQSPYIVNFRNPASYIAFDSLSLIADFSLSIVSSKFRTTSLTQEATYARPNYLVIGLPVLKRWRTSVGVLPYSDMGYSITDNYQMDTIGRVDYKYEGSGGLMQLYWGNAFKICKGLSIGLNTSYIFGRLSNTRYAEFSNSYFYNTRIDQSTYIDGIHLSAGAQYVANINTNHTIGIGVVYENTAYIWARQNTLINYYEDAYSSVVSYDTVLNQVGTKGNLVIPQSIGGGVSYSFKNKLLVAADVTWQNWANYRMMGKSDSLKDCITASLGFQITPDPVANNYLKKISYSFGANYSTGYFSIRQTSISHFAVTAGLTFPLRTFNTKSSLHVYLEYGKMGTLENNLIREDYFKISANFILQEKWYRRVKLD